MKNNFKQRTLKFAVVSALVLGSAGFGVYSYAGTGNSDLAVTATVAANCTIATTAAAFGTYDPIVTNASADLLGTGTVTVNCTSGSTDTITLGQGANAGGGSTDVLPVRRMLSGSNLLSYTLYKDSGRSTVWNNTTGLTNTGSGAAQALTVYGSITAGQNVPAGNYADTVVATVTF